jgi:hypothetical protein
MQVIATKLSHQKRDHSIVYNKHKNDVLNQSYMIRFSFWDGFFSFFNITDKRIDRLKNKLHLRKDSDNIRHDWMMVGKDLRVSFDKLKQEVEIK